MGQRSATISGALCHNPQRVNVYCRAMSTMARGGRAEMQLKGKDAVRFSWPHVKASREHDSLTRRRAQPRGGSM